MMHIPDQIRCYNRVVVDGIEALCIFPKRFACPCRYSDMLPRFARPVHQFCMIWISFIKRNRRLGSFREPWLSQATLQNYAHVIHANGAPL